MMSSKVSAARAEQPPALMMMSLPYDLIVDIVARVPRCNYPIVSLVSKSFQSLVGSSHLYTRRSLSGCTEHCLYVVLSNNETCEHHLCILRRKVNSNRVVIIRSLPYVRHSGGCEYVAVGSKIYAVSPFTGMFSIDCRSHTMQQLPGIPQLKDGKVADIIDGKIYVITWHGVMVFDTETQPWDPVMKKLDVELHNMSYGYSVVVEDKIYVREVRRSFVYEPKESKWESEDRLNPEQWDDACVVESLLSKAEVL
ncbi:unnamed protein product [Thlaspi arvense]|uniref:F-box domain-containing protein n=1 Tax=Thlaspi arvense TaxID=13288 RepID=A0AAU9T3W0_THLAR|nr:unnamed protein product [Thlaspi arvense]